ncbi:uncharacterized protein LY89DRAFT_687830 [Mollisia scopiformis]|uniref:F-box domain-containing protein n=1 Tax=Mollisia scopiformis TaxID=149040 RepID=A0A194WY89_MOLSC|nr:uncharacterized protein LY89DRAFT_687830 [Mollisia scopiformis]KUJ12900.1 hypothetical protein LY89DRAFT_687830 [Mollisia scopiformis]
MEVFNLLAPTLSGTKDEYGKDFVPPLPLSVDRVMENRPFKSPAPLLQLAPEILGIILSHIDSDSLSSLALVNSDCRQLARSRQFASVCFDYSDASLDLISLLLDEKASRNSTNNNLGSKFGAIEPCVRRLTVAAHPGWVQYRHHIDLSEFAELDESVQQERLAKASDAFSLYKRDIESILSSRAALLHLELLDWEDKVPLVQSFFNSLTTSSIQHLKLYRVSVDEDFEVIQPSVSNRWDLRSLNMEILPKMRHMRDQRSTSRLCASLLQSCSHSLETLVWGTCRGGTYTFGSNPADFPRLAKVRNLGLSCIKFSDIGTVNALLESSLSVLDLEYNYDPVIVEALRKHGRIRSLETLLFSISNLLGGTTDNYIEFLKENTQISKLTILGSLHCKEGEPGGDIPETVILPILSSSFHALTSLRLGWNENVTSVPDAALVLISKMETLEQVCLTVGCQFGWKYDWLVDHESIRNHLSSLPRLKKIAFTRDSYQSINSLGEIEHGLYYSDRTLPIAQLDAAGVDWRYGDLRQQIEQFWEDEHKKRMILEAGKYAAVIPRLEWIYIG